MSQFWNMVAGAGAGSRAIGNSSWIASPMGTLPVSRFVVNNSGPRISQNNPVAVNAYRNYNTMADNRTFTRGYAHPSASGYTDDWNSMRNLVHMGEGYRVSVRDAMNRDLANRSGQTKVIYKTRPSTGVNTSGGQVVNQNAWRSQQNSSGLGRNRGYSNGMSQFAINNSANSGLNRMR
jgi:hypothetical protein